MRIEIVVDIADAVVARLTRDTLCPVVSRRTDALADPATDNAGHGRGQARKMN